MPSVQEFSLVYSEYHGAVSTYEMYSKMTDDHGKKKTKDAIKTRDKSITTLKAMIKKASPADIVQYKKHVGGDKGIIGVAVHKRYEELKKHHEKKHNKDKKKHHGKGKIYRLIR